MLGIDFLKDTKEQKQCVILATLFVVVVVVGLKPFDMPPITPTTRPLISHR
jgi:hypothetical protein